MTTIDLPLAPRITLADLRRVNAHVVLVALIVVFVAWASGLVGQAGSQARQRADLLQHEQQVSARVRALAVDRAIEQSFFDATRRQAIDARLAAVVAERTAISASRAATLAGANAVLASSAGKVDEGRRAPLAAAVAVLAAPETVYSRIAAATADVARLTDEVSAAEAAWNTEQLRLAAARSVVTPVSRTSATRSTAAPRSVGSVQDVGEAALRALPGNAGVSIHWDDPDLSGHLGAVWAGNTSYIMVNGTALASNPGKARDVVRHEIAHIYQGRLAAAAGLSWSALGERMSPAFGANAQEKAADCVARRFGATWTHYTSDCDSADKQAWVDGLIGGYLP